MATLPQRIVALLEKTAGLSDREIATALLGAAAPQQSVNQACRILADRGVITRANRPDGRIGNYLGVVAPAPALPRPRPSQRFEATHNAASELSEDDIKRMLRDWLERDGWTTTVRWGHERGADIEASRGHERWIIEVKGSGSSGL